MSARISWHGVSPNLYRTKGAEVRFIDTFPNTPPAWWAFVGKRVRGPLRDPDSAMDAAAEMLAAARKAPPP